QLLCLSLVVMRCQPLRRALGTCSITLCVEV
ncbi:superoxide dismutase, partial [Vibrio cholerae]|nr:superoxide dismutase [Vibrio cholerae]